MRGDDERRSDAGGNGAAALPRARRAEASEEQGVTEDPESLASQSSAEVPPPTDDSITSELAALYDDGRNYAQAEIAFQKTRAKIAGRQIGVALVCGILAIVLIHIAFLALAVGLVMALAPLVTIWGAIAIVVGGLVFLVALLGLKAKSSGEQLASLFAAADEDAA